MIHERYRIEGLLGRGGMGAVYKAHHVGLRRDVAIKVLHEGLSRDPSTAKRFDREAQSVSRLDHRNCVRVTDFGTTEAGVKYLVMELLEGAELEASLGQPWAPDKAVDTIVQMLEGLEHAHHFGIVHRDLKPENVFVTTDFRGDEIVKLVDFGIAKLIDDEGAKEQLTRAGMVFGTPRYMSPEQASGGKLDERTDLYAAGLILYQMLAGHPPFVSDDAATLLRMHILADPPALPPSVPAPLAQVVAKLLEKSRNDRRASAREVIDELTQLRPGLVGSASAPVPASPAVTGPSATPSMQTHAEVAGGSSAWQPAAPTHAPAPAHAPAHAPAPIAPPSPAPLAAPVSAPAVGPIAAPVGPHNPGPIPRPIPNPIGPGATPTLQEPNAATHGHQLAAHGGHPGHPHMAMITNYEPAPVRPAPTAPARPWLPWVIGAVAVMVALMAFGAGQALHPGHSEPAPSDKPGAAGSKLSGSALEGDAASPAARAGDPDAPDMDCSDRVCACHRTPECELSCERDCEVRCIDVGRCEITVGDDSVVACERVGSCAVQCLGDCEVQCPRGGCEVECSTTDKKGKQKRKKSKKCGDTYLCGRDCDDDD
ncbi:Serine/threonine protein kinase PrkC, regulator of stationary phase [Enhygromyxa salina]|uniref:Serine/threonine protein kinase PrkC, regulator of stationary phase n=2 Tax=Enhygromyxa salina TaxID=215803 RepID=A0A0C1ZA56_9BACT|nr:Serine/threonine protein kinase PrkC, regulator of stationary phase [Enhygromyxa salina]